MHKVGGDTYTSRKHICQKYTRQMLVLVISASHNTFEYNGIKFFNGDGYKLDDLLEERLKIIIISGIDVNSHITGDKIGKCLDAGEDVEELTLSIC